MSVTIIDDFVFAQPTQEEWKDFCQSVKNLNLKPKDSEEKIMDGFEVNCYIAFNEDLIKFHIINPRFNKFREFENLVNLLIGKNTILFHQTYIRNTPLQKHLPYHSVGSNFTYT